jgi:Fic family protein
MDHSLFTKNATGKLIPIEFPRKDYAFVPHKLPPKWTFAPELWPLLAEAKEALGTLNGIGQTLRDPELLLRPLQSRESLASSSIEGTFVTPEQLLLYKLDPKEPTSASEKRADWQEVFAYSQALQHGCDSLRTMPLCNRVVKEMHQVLMRGARGRTKTPGEFRKLHVQIGSSGRYVPPLPSEIEPLMDDLERFINNDESYDPLVRAFIAHYQFEAIHPFTDGNGRVGRALMALMIYSQLKHHKPWLYLSAFFETYKDEYIHSLFRISTEGDWTAWVTLCLRATIAQANDSISRCHLFNYLKEEFHQRAATPTPRTHSIIESLFVDPIINIPKVQRQFEVTYKTAKCDVTRLVECGVLDVLDGVRPTTFYSPEIMEAAYGTNPSKATLHKPAAMRKAEGIGDV